MILEKMPIDNQASEPSSDIVFETIRSEISAAKTIRRTVLVRKVCERLQFNKNKCEFIDRDIELLIKRKEVLVVGQGLITITPIRIIELCPTRLIVLSALPTFRLEALIGHTLIGNIQRCVQTDMSLLSDTIKKIGGIFLSVDDYAAIELTPVANEQWLNELSRRQNDPLSNRYSVETLENCHWYQQSWKLFEDASGKPTLWRTENSYGKAVFIWSDKSDLINGKGLFLTRSDAIRTQYAIDNMIGSIKKGTYQKVDDGYNLILDAYLPMNEFKLLTCFSYEIEKIDGLNVYHIYDDCMERLAELLKQQLGIELMEKN